MKQLSAILTVLILCLPAGAANSINIVVSVTDKMQVPQQDIVVQLTPNASQPTFVTNQLSLQSMQKKTGINGTTTLSNVLYGTYSLRINVNPLLYYTNLTVGTNLSGTWTLASLLNLATNTTPPDTSQQYYTVGQINALLAGIGSGTNSSPWTTSGSLIYPNGGASGGGWTAAGSTIYPN